MIYRRINTRLSFTFKKQICCLKRLSVKYNWNFFFVISAFIHCLALSNNVTKQGKISRASKYNHVCRLFQKNLRMKLIKKKVVVWYCSNIANVAENAKVFLRQRTDTVWPNRERKMSDVYIIYHSWVQKNRKTIFSQIILTMSGCAEATDKIG